ILSSGARDKHDEGGLGDTHWNRVLSYANEGLVEDFLIITVPGGYYNALITALQRLSERAGHVAVDIKITYLADKNGSTPNYYNVNKSIILEPIETDDKRFYDYFTYTTNFGILLEARGRGLFSNYMRNRWVAPERSTLNV